MSVPAPWLRWWVALLLGLAACMQAPAGELRVDSGTGMTPVRLTPYWDVLEDHEARLDIAQVSAPALEKRFAPSGRDTDSLNFGLRASPVWLRITLANPGPRDLERLLEIAFVHLHSVELYVPSEQGYRRIATGHALPYAQRPFDHRNFVFPLLLQGRSVNTYYLRVASGTSLDVPARLWEPRSFAKQSLLEYILQSLYFGMLLALGMYNFLLFASLRDRTYLYYVLFVAANALSTVAFSGIGFQFLWPEAPRWSMISSMVGFALTGCTLLLFQRDLLGTRATLPWLDRVMRGFLLINALQIAGFWLLPYQRMITIGITIDAANMVLALIVGVVALVRGQRSARFFLLAFCFLACAALLTALRSYGVKGIPNFLAVYGMQIGSALEMLLLSLTLADRFNQVKREKEMAQQQLVDHLKRSERELEQRVLERTAALSDMNRALRAQESALARAKEDAEQASRMKSAFLANMSHEIRTPMNAVIGMAYLALHSGLSGRQRDYVEKIHRASVSLLGIINDILDFSKIESGKLSVERTRFSLREVLANVNAVTAERAAGKGLRYLIDVAADVPAQLEGDPLRLGQVLINLTTNAIKFTPEGQVRLRCRVSAAGGDSVTLRFEVEDTGIGIDAGQRARLFQPFTQADESTTRKFGGTGLGLAISKRLVELMGGDITVHSEAGKGSCFGFTLDFGCGGNNASLPQADTAAMAGALPRLDGCRVLLVEDNAVNRQIACEMLAAAGIETAVAENGRQALDMLFAAGPGAYDLVLMDIQMPEMNGHAAVRRLRMDARFAELPVVAMTAHAGVEELARCMNSGMQDHVGKPIDPGHFYQVLQRWIRARLPVDHMPAPPASSPSAQHALPELPGFDTADTLERLGGDLDFYHRLLEMLADSLTQALRRLDAARAADDESETLSVLHEIRGMAANVGAVDLARCAKKLEARLKEQAVRPEQWDAFHALIAQTRQLVQLRLAQRTPA